MDGPYLALLLWKDNKHIDSDLIPRHELSLFDLLGDKWTKSSKRILLKSLDFGSSAIDEASWRAL
ncbi:unnamed protein product [Dovyalis caffra]|uniref:Uncharacterized protein n=1 Tax=Dovyalis caffra TaxID=77055 RepID=A0AAV1R6J1_9ROSI|nr:unnamed protein product [Dovyalis caffra]